MINYRLVSNRDLDSRSMSAHRVAFPLGWQGRK